MFSDNVNRKTMLKRLVDRATSATDYYNEESIELDILVILVREEPGLDELVLKMMREVSNAANADHESLRDQLRASEDHNFRIQERQAEHSDMFKERAILLERLNESEAAINHVKSELTLEMDRFAWKKKELHKQKEEVQSQLEWLCSENNDNIAKLDTQKKVYKRQLCDVEKKLSEVKARNADELKKAVKEKNFLAKTLKSEKDTRKRLEEKLNHYAEEIARNEEIRYSCENEVQVLKERVGQIEGEKQEKDALIARNDVYYVKEMKERLVDCRQNIQSLQVELMEEMSKHAPLYGVGLEDRSSGELATLSKIHEIGLRNVHALQRQRGSLGANPLLGPNASSNSQS